MKTNRRFILTAVLALALTFIFSCSSDSNEPSGGSGDNTVGSSSSIGNTPSSSSVGSNGDGSSSSITDGSSSSNNGGSSSSGGSVSLEGTWIGDDETITFSSSSFVISMDNVQGIKGTYTVSGTTITMTVTHIHGIFLNDWFEDLGDDIYESEWYNKNGVVAALREWLKENLPLTDESIEDLLEDLSENFDGMFSVYTATIAGNTITGPDGTTYTKVP